MLTILVKFDHAAVVGCCARRTETSVALPPKRDSDPLRQGESELLLPRPGSTEPVVGSRRPKRRTMWSLLSGFGFPRTRASVVVPVFPENQHTAVRIASGITIDPKMTNAVA